MRGKTSRAERREKKLSEVLKTEGVKRKPGQTPVECWRIVSVGATEGEYEFCLVSQEQLSAPAVQ